MRLFALAFVLATLWVQHAGPLPPPERLGLAGAAALLALRLAPRGALRLALLLAAGAGVGSGLAGWRAQERLAEALPRAWEGRDIALTGVVASLPRVTPRGTRFVLEVEHAAAPVPRSILLAWYGERRPGGVAAPVPVQAGERWRLTVRLKRPRALANPHGFDFEWWAFERGLRAAGYVRARPAPQRLAARVDGWPQTLHRWRGAVRASMQAHLGGAPGAGVLVALAIGDQDAIGAREWEVFWRTGVGHLMSISGLHITMLAGLGFALVRRAWAAVPALALRLPARKAAVAAGTATALAYALMTGFAVPAQRTFVMLAVLAGCVLADRHGSPSRVLALAALAVLLLDPWAAMSAGFWLSFGAVAAIFYAMALRTGRPGMAARALREQAAVTAAMAPLLLALFHQVSLASPLANALAIPVVSLAVVPLAVAGAFLGVGALLDGARALLGALMPALEWLAASPLALLESHAPAPWTVAAALAGCAWLLAPRGVPLRACGALWLLPLFAFAPPRPPPGEAWIDVLDVGHGLAAVVRTRRHALAYDAGPSWDDEADSGARIVVPFLRGEGIARLDAQLVTHGDDDHAGGALSVAQARPPAWLLSSLDAGHAVHRRVARSEPCAAGQRWQWDGVRFAVLHPGAGATGARSNDRSCVLRVETRAGAALLTGDIEARSEAALLARSPAALRAQVLLVPHHGSRTSSTAAFLEAIAPREAVASVGYRNRFGHPHPAVAARYAGRGIRLRRTDLEGALRIVLPAQPGVPPRVQPHARPVRYWREPRSPP